MTLHPEEIPDVEAVARRIAYQELELLGSRLVADYSHGGIDPLAAPHPLAQLGGYLTQLYSHGGVAAIQRAPRRTPRSDPHAFIPETGGEH